MWRSDCLVLLGLIDISSNKIHYFLSQCNFPALPQCSSSKFWKKTVTASGGNSYASSNASVIRLINSCLCSLLRPGDCWIVITGKMLFLLKYMHN